MFITYPELVHDTLIAIVMMAWVIFVTVYLAKLTYNYALKKGWSDHSAKYFARKVIHTLAGGLVAFLLPFTFEEPLYPLIMALIISALTYSLHRSGKLMYWFQDPENEYEVHFALMWGIVIFITWFISKSFWLGVVPALMMSWGDGITGIIRNIRYKKRVKGWEGSIGMLIVSIAVGLKFGIAGIIAAVLATLVERWNKVDDNITVPLVSLVTLLICIIFFTPLTKILSI